MAELKVRTLAEDDVGIEARVVDDFARGLRGTLLRPGDDGYDEARTVWNGMTDKRPGLIARCAGPADVVRAVDLARTHNLLVAVRGGDHSVAGHSVCNGGLMIDLSPMRSVRVDPTRRTARAEGGARWRDFDRETQAFGLATTGGTNSDTGIGGLTLGGGLGWLAGKYGLACDNLLSADVVTADGRLLTASADEHPELFWGLRGGGGNLGIVTSFKYRLHPVDTVLGGMIVHPFERAREVLQFYAEFSTRIPDEVNTLGVLLTLPDGPRAVAIAVCYNGDLKKGEEALRPLREFGQPLADDIQPMPYLALQTMVDDVFPRGRKYYWKAHLMEEIGDDAIETIVNYFSEVPSPFSALGFQQLGNAANRVDPGETAFSHRDALYDFLMLSGWEDPAESERNIAWTRDLYEAMKPWLHEGIYVNALGAEDTDQKRIRAAYRPETYERLVALKSQYDPTNLFRLNPNITPAG